MLGPCTLLVETNPGDKSSVVTYEDNEEPIYKVKSCNTTMHRQREVFEVLGETEFPLFMLQKQIATLHARCDGYGTSCNDIKTFGKKLLTMSKNEVVQHHTKLNVKLFDTLTYTNFSLENMALITNTLETGDSVEDKDNCMIIGSWSKKTLTIYKAGSSTVIAKVLPLNTNDKFKVDVSSNVGCAFVISLIAAVDCMKDPGTLKRVGKAVGFVLNASAAVALVTEGVSFLG